MSRTHLLRVCGAVSGPNEFLLTALMLLICERSHSARQFLVPGALIERRVTLVIGNSTYQRNPKFSNANNDATDMAAGLKKFNFQAVPLFPWVTNRGVKGCLF